MNRFGAEYPCAQGWGIFDGLSDDTVPKAVASWGVNSVRILLNEDCWLGINGAAAKFSGENYRNAIIGWVNSFNSHGLLVIVTLAWVSPGTNLALGQQIMANKDHSIDFWRSAAAAFASNRSVLFDLYGEPRDIDWGCWRDGCVKSGIPVAGMQSLVDAVRSTGAKQPLIVSGVDFANDLSQWVNHAPSDPGSSLIAGFHLYNFNSCVAEACWTSTVGEVAKKYPVITTEFGQNNCKTDFITRYMQWADKRKVSYLAWAWAPWEPCASGLGASLVTTEDGQPTAYGKGFRDHIRSIRPG